MSDAGRLIEKFGLAIHGEEPAVVVTVLVAFVRQICEQWGVSVESFTDALRTADLDSKAGRS